MDAYYASIEQRDHPQYRGKPIAVGGSPEGRGVVATASYEARKFGVRSAMSSKTALRLCPDVIFVHPRFDVYKQVSSQIRSIFQRYTDQIEPLSIDEAYLDVTVDKLNIGSAIEIATRIKKEIREELGLTASAGVSINKFVAKIASDMKKPDGLTFIGPSKIASFMEQLPVEKFFGVGKVTAEKMNRLGLFTGADVKKLSESELTRHFGKSGKFYFKIVRGEDDREVVPYRESKSIGAEDTFPHDLTELNDMLAQLDRIAALVADRLNNKRLNGRTVTLKIKYHDFKTITRRITLESPVGNATALAALEKQMMIENEFIGMKVRLLGISVSNFRNDSKSVAGASDQLNLF